MSKQILFNLSGHPVPAGADEFEVLDAGVVPNVDMTDSQSIPTAATEIVSQLPKDVLSKGNFTVVLPGLTPLAVAIVTVLHGVSGGFNFRVAYSVREQDGAFRLIDQPLDLFQIRLDSRELR